MQVSFKAGEGASVFDLVLNTYSSLDLLPKFLKDNNITSYNFTSKVGDVFFYETELKTDEYIINIILKNNYSFTTSNIKTTEAINTGSYLLAETGFVLTAENGNKILI